MRTIFKLMIIFAACLLLSVPISFHAMEKKIMNEDVKNSDVKETTIEKVSSIKNANTKEIPIVRVTSSQIRKLTSDMTYKDAMDVLGETKDVGSGYFILLYDVDENYQLYIPFAGDNAKLGITGEKLLKSLKPKE